MIDKDMIDCNSCKSILVTEREQNLDSEKPHHFCMKHRKRLFHRGQHPRIVPDNECEGKDFDFRKGIKRNDTKDSGNMVQGTL